MTTPDDRRPLPGLEGDISCPVCDYNLRGLTVARCPECGSDFDPRALRFEPRESGGGPILAIMGGFLALAILAAALWPLLVLLLVVAAMFAVSGAQAALEVMIASLILREMDWRRFRAWWEGVLIGYAACALTINLAGWAVAGPSLSGWPAWPRGFAPIFALTCLEALAIQWWVVHRRLRGWHEPVAPMRLLAACLAGKAAAELVWALLPLDIIRWPA